MRSSSFTSSADLRDSSRGTSIPKWLIFTSVRATPRSVSPTIVASPRHVVRRVVPWTVRSPTIVNVNGRLGVSAVVGLDMVPLARRAEGC